MTKEPKKSITKEHQTFIDVVGIKEVGSFLFRFYKKYLDFGGSPTIFKKRKLKIRNLGERRIYHLRSVIEKYELEHVIDCAAYIVERIDNGQISTRFVRPGYFDKVLLNKSSQDEKNSGFSYD